MCEYKWCNIYIYLLISRDFLVCASRGQRSIKSRVLRNILLRDVKCTKTWRLTWTLFLLADRGMHNEDTLTFDLPALTSAVQRRRSSRKIPSRCRTSWYSRHMAYLLVAAGARQWAASYRHLLGLVQQTAGRRDGPRPRGQPVRQHGGQRADAHQRGGRQGPEELTQVLHLRDPQARHHLLGLHLLHQGGTQLWGGEPSVTAAFSLLTTRGRLLWLYRSLCFMS